MLCSRCFYLQALASQRLQVKAFPSTLFSAAASPLKNFTYSRQSVRHSQKRLLLRVRPVYQEAPRSHFLCDCWWKGDSSGSDGRAETSEPRKEIRPEGNAEGGAKRFVADFDGRPWRRCGCEGETAHIQRVVVTLLTLWGETLENAPYLYLNHIHVVVCVCVCVFTGQRLHYQLHIVQH